MENQEVDLANVASTMQVSWHSRLWNSTISAFNLAQIINNPSKQQKNEDNSHRQQAELSNDDTQTNGPSILNYSLRSKLLFNLLAEWKSLPLEEYSEKLKQLNLLKKFLSSQQQVLNVESADWSMILSSLTASIMCFYSTFSEQTLATLCANLLALDSLKDNLHASSASIVSTIVNIKLTLTLSTHKRFVAMSNEFLNPFFDVLSTAVQNKSLIGNDSVALRGSLWSLLAAFKLHLLVPPSSCDPAAKYSVKLSNTIHDIENKGKI